HEAAAAQKVAGIDERDRLVVDEEIQEGSRVGREEHAGAGCDPKGASAHRNRILQRVASRDGRRASAASEPRERSAPAKRRARERVGESEGRSPPDQTCYPGRLRTDELSSSMGCCRGAADRSLR